MAYTMSKSAVNILGTNLAKEMAPYRVNVNVIMPGCDPPPHPPTHSITAIFTAKETSTLKSARIASSPSPFSHVPC